MPNIPLTSDQVNQAIAALQGIAHAVRYQPFWDTPIFGVIVGTAIGLLPSLYLLYHDRPIIKVTVDRGWFIRDSSIPPRVVLTATVSNSGRRAINVKSIYLRLGDGSSLVFPADNSFANGASGLPMTLGESSSHSLAISAGTIANGILKKEQYPVAVCFTDALGRSYECKTKREFWDEMFRAENESEK